jgi:hypothetical protein
MSTCSPVSMTPPGPPACARRWCWSVPAIRTTSPIPPASFTTPPHLDGNIVYARDIPEQRAALRAAFPGRRLYQARLVDGAFGLVPVDPPP